MILPYVDATREIYTINTDGTDLTQLTQSGVGVTNEAPSWSPDPNNPKIVFSSDRKWNNHQIYEMDIDGTAIEAITCDSNFNHYEPVYIPM